MKHLKAQMKHLDTQMKYLDTQMKYLDVHIKRVSKQLTNKVSPSRLSVPKTFGNTSPKQNLLCLRAPSSIRLPPNDVCPKSILMFAEQGISV